MLQIVLFQVAVPQGEDTTYWCRFVELPEMTEKHHFIMVRVAEILSQIRRIDIDSARIPCRNCYPAALKDSEVLWSPELVGGQAVGREVKPH